MSKNYEDQVTEEILYGTNVPDAYDVKCKVERKQQAKFNNMVTCELTKITNKIQEHYVKMGNDYPLDVELSPEASQDKSVIEEISKLLSNKNWVVDGVFDSTDTTKRIWIRPKRISDSFHLGTQNKEDRKRSKISKLELIVTVLLVAFVVSQWR